MEYVQVIPKPKVVTTRVVCKQDSIIADVSCKNGYYSISECTGVDRPSASLLCNGTFKMISCMDGGGSGFSCAQPDKQSQDVICTGLWDGSKCIGQHSPQLIKIPNDLYLYGFCDGNFKVNISCTGRFYDANYYTCSKDPYTVQDFKSVCFYKAKFGECQGLLDSAGCKGSYSDIVMVSGKQMDMKSRSDSHFDFKNIAGNVTFKVSQPSKTDTRRLNVTATKIRCRVGALLAEKVCMGAEYIYSAQESKADSSETTTTIFMKCPGNLTLEGLKCPANMSVSTCRGSSPDPEPSERMSCIGDFHQKVCVNGGTELTCAADSSINRYVECNGQSWDRNTCVDSQSGPWSGFSRKEGPLLRDSEGNDLKSVRYITKEFTLNKPSIKKLSVENCTVKSVHLQTGSRAANGSFENLHSPPSYNSLELSQGDLAELVFSNLQLDDVDFAEINKDTSAKVIQLQIETLVISEAAGLQVELRNILAKSLEVGESVSHDVKIGSLSLLNSKTSLRLSNVTINFPVVSSDVAKTELEKPERSRSTRLPFYDVGLYMADFIFKLKPGGSLSTKNFIEFPEYKLERLKVGEMSAKHFTLRSRQLGVASTGSGSNQTPANQGQTPNAASTKPQ